MIILIISIIHIIFYYDQNISLIFLYERWIPCQASTSVLCLQYRPQTVHCSTKYACTSEITFLALLPCFNARKCSFLLTLIPISGPMLQCCSKGLSYLMFCNFGKWSAKPCIRHYQMTGFFYSLSLFKKTYSYVAVHIFSSGSQ